MSDWPASLPQIPFSGLKEVRQSGTLRSEMDTGAPKQRKRFTAAVRNVDVPMVFTQAQRQTFDTFFITTLGEGALPFTWTMDSVDEGTGTSISYRFTKPPAMSKIANEWRLTLNLEILP